MNKIWTILAVIVGLSFGIGETALDAASLTSYVASDDPGAAPDSNGNADDAWTVSTMVPQGAGGAGSFFGFGDSWVLFSFPDGAEAGTALADHTFVGGALDIGQTVALDWGNSAIQAGASVGVSLTSGGTRVVTLRWLGDSPVDSYLYDDDGGAGQEVGQTFMYQTPALLEFTLDSATTYSASYNGVPWSGTYSGPIDGIQVFNDAAGNGSDVIFNNLRIIPEPNTIALVLVSGLMLIACRPVV